MRWRKTPPPPLPPVKSATGLTAFHRFLFSPPLSRPRLPPPQPLFACPPVPLAALPGCDVSRRLRRGSRVRPAARRPPLSPGTEGRDMPAAAACPAPPPAPPAPPAPAAAPSPEALGTWHGAPRPPGGAAAPRRGRGSGVGGVGGRSPVRCGSLRGANRARGGRGGSVMLAVISRGGWRKPKRLRVCGHLGLFIPTAFRAPPGAAAGVGARGPQRPAAGSTVAARSGSMVSQVLIPSSAPTGGDGTASPCLGGRFGSR